VRLHRWRRDHPVHIHARPDHEPLLSVETQILRPIQMFYIDKIFRLDQSIPHADEDVRPTQERARFIRIPDQELAGLTQRGWPDIVKFR
jgi:hypothetical protein